MPLKGGRRNVRGAWAASFHSAIRVLLVPKSTAIFCLTS